MTLAEQLVRDEGEILHAYQDSEGWWTIGVGRLIDKRKGGGITHQESLYLLSNDIAKVELNLPQALPWTALLDDARRGVLLNMAFNLGIGGLLGFHHTLASIQAGDYVLARDHMLVSKWASQVGVRAQRLAKQIVTGEWQ